MNHFSSKKNFIQKKCVTFQLDRLGTENAGSHDLHTNTEDIKEQHVNEITEWKAEDLSHVTSKLKNTTLDHHHSSDIKSGASMNLMR